MIDVYCNRLQDETARVEDALSKDSAIDALVKCFVNAKANSFENLLDPFLKICRISKTVTIGIAQSQFFQRLIDRLGHTKAVVRLSLLKLLRAICDVHPNRLALVEKYGIYDIVDRLSTQDDGILVRELAREIKPTLAPALKPVFGKPGRNSELAPKLGVTPRRRPRRAASDASSTQSESPRFGSNSSILTPRTQTSGIRQKTVARQRIGEFKWTSEQGQ